jgi:pyruvate, water dikinase
MPVEYLYRLEQIQPPDRSLVGDKAFDLGLLKQQGCSVLPGIVVSAAMLQAFLEKIEWQTPMLTDLPHSALHVDVDQPQQLQVVAQQIRQAILSGDVPAHWIAAIESAVQDWRSLGKESGQALIFRPSFALKNLDVTVSHRPSGLLESHLCGWSQEAIAHSLKKTWAELFRARSLLYWQRLGIQLQQINLAVLIQPIGSVIASGDVQVSADYLDIRATWGLGLGLVNGEIIPDRYRIHRRTESQTRSTGSKLYSYTIALSEDLPAARYARFTSEQFMAENAQAENAQALTEDQLQTLKRLVQKTTANLAIVLNLEWTLCQLPEQPPEIYITQAIPQLTIGQSEKDQKTEILQPAADNLALPPPPSLVSSTVLTGLSASRGTIASVAWVCQPGQAIDQIPAHAILVASMLTPEQIAGLQQVAGIVTEQGGMTSHGAILAREMGIPAVVGVRYATQRIQTGDRLWLNGDRGEVHLAMGEQEVPATQARGQSEAQSELSQFPGLPHLALLPRIATQLWVTLSQTHLIAAASHLSVDGVGLLRSELLLLEALQDQRQDLSERIADLVRPFAAAFAPRPVFYRSLDLRSHEFPSLSEISEMNPTLGVRGTFSYQLNPTLFDQELVALRQVQQNGYGNLHLILPFVRTVEEFCFCRQRVEQAGLTQNPHFRLWIMAEVPSVLLLLQDYVRAGVQGIAIGSNDLTQLLLGIDRDHPQMQTAFDQHHPAVMRALQHLIQTAQQLEIPCSICGQAASQYPEIIESLIRWGITSISVDPSDVETAHETIARAEQRILLEAARKGEAPQR